MGESRKIVRRGFGYPMVRLIVLQIDTVEGKEAHQSIGLQDAWVCFDVLGTLSEPIFEGIQGLLASGIELAPCIL